MAASSLDGLYYEFHIPLGLKTLIEQLIVNQPAQRNSSALVSGSATNREWFSQARVSTDTTTEVITAYFKLPLSVSEIGFDILRVPCRAEVWYLDRLNNWRQVLDRQRIPVTLSVQYSSSASWYTFHSSVYPLVAQAVQIRITRVADPAVGTNPYVVGLKNTLIRRNIYDRAQGKLPFEDEQDPLGNVVSKYIEDWDAALAIDNKPFTFWRSAPMPDPNAVVNLFLDTRKYDGTGQYMDGIFLDPTYSNQKLNVYYSNDEETGTTRLSPITLRPETLDTTDTSLLNDFNTDWRSGRGRWDNSAFPSGQSRYRVNATWGPLVSQNAWIGIEWIPDFDAASPPPYNPVLFEAVPPVNPTTGQPAWTSGQYQPAVYYDSGAGTIVLKLYDGSTTKTYAAALSPLLAKGQALRIVVGWSYNPDKVYISVKDRQGNQVALHDRTVPNTSPTAAALPANISFDGRVGFSNFRGTFTAHIVKRENHSGQGEAFQANPMMYVDPDPVLPNTDGSIPSTTLDNALYAVDWTAQPHGTGGAHESFYTGKRWTPVWRDYITRRGKLFFPQAISAKFLKLEFTGLTEESYPVYDAGVSTTYQVFPVALSQSQTVMHPGLLANVAGMQTVGAQTVLGALGTVNWLNPQTVATAINSVFGPVANPVVVQAGPGYVTGSIPGTAQSPVTDNTRTELSSPYVYRRGLLDPSALAANHIYYSGFTTWDQTLSNAAGLIRGAIADSFAPLRNYITNPSLGPVQGNDFWVFPGGTLKLPAAVMNGLTALTETYLGRKPTTETRLRFNTESVHRYDTRTVKRDAAVAYFAGVREVQPLLTSYLTKQDPVVFTFDNYTTAQGWGLDNTRLVQDRITTQTLDNGDKINVGPLSTDGRSYSIENADFDLALGETGDQPVWTVKGGTWNWDNSPFNGRWYPGTAKATATGATTELWSTPITSYPGTALIPGRQITITAYVKWADLTVTNNQPAIQLGLVTYQNGEVVSDSVVLGQISYANWSANATKAYTPISATWTVPSGVDAARIRLVVTDKASAGSVWFDSITLSSADDLVGRAYQTFTTVSNFAKLRCKFTDSNIVRSNSMWLREDPTATNIDNTALAYYTSFISLDLFDNNGVPREGGGNWADPRALWADSNVSWGSPQALVNITIHPDRVYDGKRVLHFTRLAGAGEVGVRVRQWNNFIPSGLFRICARWLKPRKNTNTITVRLRRVSDGVVIYQEEIANPASGYWHEFATSFQRVPTGSDQVYTVELVTTGDAEDELYLSDLWVELSHIRYFITLGSGGTPMDVTDLRYADTAIVSCSEPVNEFTVEARIYTPMASITGCTIQPTYLK